MAATTFLVNYVETVDVGRHSLQRLEVGVLSTVPYEVSCDKKKKNCVISQALIVGG